MKRLLPFVVSFALIGCSDSTPTESTVENTAQTIAVPAETEINTTSTSVTEPVASAEEVSAPAKEAMTSVPEAAAIPVAKAAVAPKVEKAASAVVAPVAASIDGGTVFAQKCASCHGQKAEKSALSKSQVIAGWDVQKIKDALHGYQAGTYGTEMKALMQAQAKGLSDAQIDALAKHISSL